jgi:ABC-2 type transport system ATP-binding protein
MPELLDPADPGRGDRALTEVARAPRPAPTVPADGRLPATSVDRPPVLLFEHVSRWYGPVIGVNEVTLELRSGITGLVGPNGAGKTTLLRLATGQLRPTLGSVRVCGHDAWRAAAKRHVGYCPDVDAFYETMSGRQFVEVMARLCGFTGREAGLRAEAALEQVGMAGRADRALRGYSKGMRQRVKVAQALLHDPPLLVLDEPLNGIDPVGRRELVALFLGLAERGKCLLVSSHELEELEKLTDHVAILARGRIAAVGTLARIRDLLDQQPLSIRIDSDGPRRLAGALVALPEVVGIEIDGGDSLVVRARNPAAFFRRFTQLVVEADLDVRLLETLDDSAHAVLGYLLGGRRA